MQILRPRSLDEALDALAAHPGATLLAGGTDLMVQVNYQGRRPEVVVALRRVPELLQMEDGFVGAGVTWSRLTSAPWPGLAQAARTVGSPQIRAMGTLGGNLGTASPAGDGLPFLAAVGAGVEVASRAGGRRTLAWDQFLVGPKRNSLQPGELILGVRLPTDLPQRQEFAKVGARNAMVISIASACLVRFADGAVRIALGSVGPTPLRAPRAEAMISADKHPSPAAAAEFGRLVAEEVRPIDDHRSTAAYRRHAAGVIARRLLERALA
ncbi:MAG: FAD binding domain-containing protein [Acidimicrobiia bacterium]|nr:FAD binding domain-containing protein [Acidimicrobiia bacterium]